MRTVAASVFLARVGGDGLPLAFVISAAATIVVSLITSKVLQYVDPGKAAAITWLLLAVTTAGMGVTLGALHHSVIVLSLFYVLAEIRGSLSTVYTVTLTNESFADLSSKRPYAIIASGAPVAGIVVGLLLGLEAAIVQAAPLMMAIALVDTMTAYCVGKSSTKQADEPGDSPPLETTTVDPPGRQEPTDNTVKDGRYRLQLSALMALQVVVLTLIAYQWNVVVADYFGVDESRLVAYFAFFYAASDVLIVLAQWLVAGNLLDRFGPGIGLKSFPILIGLAGVAALASSSLAAMMIVFTIAKGLDVIRRSLHDPALASAYSVLNPAIRRNTIVLTKGMIKPFAEAASASLLVLLGAWVTDAELTWIWLGIIPLWLYFAWRATANFRQRGSDKLSENGSPP